MKFDLFISDFDGTLGCNPDYISNENVAAIKEYEKKGGIFTIVTGRSYASIKSICDEYGLKGLVAAFQGASIVDMNTNEYLVKGGLSTEKAVFVVDRLKADNVDTVVWIDDKLFFTEHSFYVDIFLGDKGVVCEQVKDISKAIEKYKTGVNKVCGILEGADSEAALKKYGDFEKYGITVNSGAKGLLEFVNPVYNKGFAVKFIAEKYNIPLSKIITVGDSTNDLGLVSDLWHSVAVGDGSEILKAAAQEITVPFKQNPIKILLDKYCLND